MTTPASDLAVAVVLPHVVLHAMEAAEPRGPIALRRTSLSLPEIDDWDTRVLPSLPARGELLTWWGWQAAQLFADVIAMDSPHAGAFLALDVAPYTLRPHFYGLALTTRSDWELDELWRRLVDGDITGPLHRRVRAPTGTSTHAGSPVSWRVPDRSWTHDEDAEAAYDKLTANVRRCCRYAVKPLPDGVTLSSASRVVLSGPFDAQLARFVVDPDEDARAVLAAQLRRGCPRCGRALDVAMRRHARWCSPTCRKLASKAIRARGARKGQP